MQIRETPPLNHLDRMTDSTGLIQHAIYGVPRRESGYTTDDNARALRLCARMSQHHVDERMLDRVAIYLSFLEFARRPNSGFHNYLGYDRRWLDSGGCGDCQGQAVRALAEVLGSNLSDDHRDLARELIDAVRPALADLRSLRAQAYVVLAWGHLWSTGVKDIEPLASIAWFAAQRLVESFERARRPDWPWFESRITYANAVLPHALLVASERWPAETFGEVGFAAFEFLDRTTTCESNGAMLFSPIGSDGWYSYGETKACFDQQPVEASTMAEAAFTAFRLTGDNKHLATFHRARDWFHGLNSLKLSLIDPSSGACCDGLHPTRVNRNQGAESTLAYLCVELQAAELQCDLENSPAGEVISA
jgi:hypothetical protein